MKKYWSIVLLYVMGVIAFFGGLTFSLDFLTAANSIFNYIGIAIIIAVLFLAWFMFDQGIKLSKKKEEKPDDNNTSEK
jgi:hypothetical protein